jgi:lysophospholipase L1-like esterase
LAVATVGSRSLVARLAALLGALAVGLALAELSVRLVAPGGSVYAVLPPSLHVTLRPDSALLPGVHGEAEYVVNSVGIRGPEFPPDSVPAFAILAVGGSTTENLFLDADETWPGVMRRLLPRTADGRAVWVGDVGKSGLNARDHAVQVKYLLAQWPRINAVIVLSGVNDLTMALAASDGYRAPPPITDPAAEAMQLRRAFSMVPGPIFASNTEYLIATGAPWYKRTAVYQLLKRARFLWENRLRHSRLAEDPEGRVLLLWRGHREHATRWLDTLPDLMPALEEYRTNLNVIVDRVRASGAELVLLTQPTFWSDSMSAREKSLLWLGGTGDFQVEEGHAYYTTGALARAMAQFNDVMLDVCRARNLSCVDLAAQLPKDTTVFYDDTHFTEHGADLVGRIVARQLASHPPFLPAP